MVDSVYIPKQGDIVWLIFDPRVGHEQSGRRPAIVVSDKIMTEHTGLAVVCPITNTVKGFGFEIPLQNTKTKGVVLPIQIRSVDVQARKIEYIETASKELTAEVLESVLTLLAK